MKENDLHKAAAGADLPVDSAEIERALDELWRSANEDENAITRAALWNVVAHTDSTANHALASEILGRVSASIPQRTIVIRAEPGAAPEMASWISANCHRVGGGRQVCSEEIAVVAGGDRVRRIAPLVSALLIPDMPVAIWWLGDLPNEDAEYVHALLDPADRMIVDSADFDRVEDLDLLTVSSGDRDFFGHRIEAWLYLAWLSSQGRPAAAERLKAGSFDGFLENEIAAGASAPRTGALLSIDIELEGGTVAAISRDPVSAVLNARVNGIEQRSQTVTRARAGGTAELIVRQLNRPEGDPIYGRILPLTSLLARRASA